MKELREIRQAVLKKNPYGYLRFSLHAKQQMKKRGYRLSDVLSVLFNESNVIEKKKGFNDYTQSFCPKYTIAGKDVSQNPCVVVITKEGPFQFSVVTVMPPTDRRRFKECI